MTTAEWFSNGLAVVALGVSIWALRLARRQGSAALRPSLFLELEPEPAGFQPRESIVGTVRIRNSGTGVAYDVAFDLQFEVVPGGQSRRQIGRVPSLGVGETKQVDVFLLRPRTSGSITWQDAEDRPYWWRKASFDSAWESGKGRLPEA
jgi:hypothetical protein